jgi:nucleotide-binding universal stress UspA family protein
MFKTVIWATDGSEASERALPFAKDLLGSEEGRLVIVHVRELLVGRAGGQPVYADEEFTQSVIHDRAEELRTEGWNVTVKMVTTFDVNAGHAIAETARDLEADAIVVGTRGRGPLASAVLGSVTHTLLHDAECAVLVVPPLAVVREAQLV